VEPTLVRWVDTGHRPGSTKEVVEVDVVEVVGVEEAAAEASAAEAAETLVEATVEAAVADSVVEDSVQEGACLVDDLEAVGGGDHILAADQDRGDDQDPEDALARAPGDDAPGPEAADVPAAVAAAGHAAVSAAVAGHGSDPDQENAPNHGSAQNHANDRSLENDLGRHPNRAPSRGNEQNRNPQIEIGKRRRSVRSARDRVLKEIWPRL